MTDMASLVLHLHPTHADTIPAWLGRVAYAWFLDSLRQLQPALSAAIHDNSQLKPFTVSSLIGAEGRELTRLHPERCYTLRLTTLHPDLTRITLNGLVNHWLQTPIILHDQPFHVARIVLDDETDTRTGTSSYAALTECTADGSRLTLHFASPTTFKKTGGGTMALPLPERVFGSLLDRWRRFAGIPLPGEITPALLAEQVQIEQYQIKTRRISFERANQGAAVGFYGSVTYHITNRERQFRQAIHILAAFARYSGIGAFTTYGMGQAWTVPTGELSQCQA